MLKWIFALAAVGALSGCASIVNGRTEKVSITSVPAGATVKVHSVDGGFNTTVRTPATIELERGQHWFLAHDYVVDFNKDGYAAQSVDLPHHVSWWYILGNALFGGLPGWIGVDPATGGMYTFDDEVAATLKPGNAGQDTPAVASDPQPVQVATSVQSTEPVGAAATVDPTPPVNKTASADPAPSRSSIATRNLKLGEWSYEVEMQARQAGCQGEGAWLISPAGAKPEAYRVVCADGNFFTMVCDSVHCVKG